jgi:hypothetical protein
MPEEGIAQVVVLSIKIGIAVRFCISIGWYNMVTSLGG